MQRIAGIYGLMAEFPRPDQPGPGGAEDARGGLPEIDAYSPFPIHELVDALDPTTSACSASCSLGGTARHGCAGFGLCYWVSTIAYPLNIGGRPFNSWPSFIPVTFELTILFASFAAVLSWIRAERPADAVSPGVQRAALCRASRARKGSS